MKGKRYVALPFRDRNWPCAGQADTQGSGDDGSLCRTVREDPCRPCRGETGLGSTGGSQLTWSKKMTVTGVAIRGL